MRVAESDRELAENTCEPAEHRVSVLPGKCLARSFPACSAVLFGRIIPFSVPARRFRL